MEHLTIRFAEPSDVPQLLAFIHELAVYEELDDQAEVLLAVVDGKPVGSALFFHNFSTFLGRAGIYLEDLYVQPAYRGRGYGKALLKKLAQITVERGCGRLEWACLDWNKPSIDFYRSLGAVSMDGWTTYRLTGKTLEQMAQ